jgi:hypothetical protein
MRLKNIGQKGDTIVEVLLAMTVLSGILFTSWSIVNRASQISLASRQRVFMVDKLKEQAEIINSYYGVTDGRANVSIGKLGNVQTTSVPQTSIASNPCAAVQDAVTREFTTPVVGSFYFNNSAVATAGVREVSTFGNAVIWIQRVPVNESGDASPEYNDFYIQSCWIAPGGNVQKEDNSKIVVRLNS